MGHRVSTEWCIGSTGTRPGYNGVTYSMPSSALAATTAWTPPCRAGQRSPLRAYFYTLQIAPRTNLTDDTSYYKKLPTLKTDNDWLVLGLFKDAFYIAVALQSSIIWRLQPKNWKGCGRKSRGLFKVLSQHLRGVTVKNQEPHQNILSQADVWKRNLSDGKYMRQPLVPDIRRPDVHDETRPLTTRETPAVI
jgi:hypothetical protein